MMYEFEIDRRNLREYYLTRGVPVYTTVERAGKALANVVTYRERLKTL